MSSFDVPDIVVGRLPLYLRTLTQLHDEGMEIASSQEIARKTSLNPAQIRKDLSFFGEFGKQGTGYDIKSLCHELRRILHINEEWPVALIGYGNLGHAIANYPGFSDRGFRITRVFENDPRKIGSYTGTGLEVLPIARLADTLINDHIQIAMLTTPAQAAQVITDTLVTFGVRAILNYAPITLNVPENVSVQYIDPATHLQHMTYYLER